MAQKDATQEDTTTNARLTEADWGVIRLALAREANFAMREGWKGHVITLDGIIRKIDARGD